MKAVFVSRFEPKAVGHGGNHRAYQILYDLQRVAGMDNVLVVTLSQPRRSLLTDDIPTPVRTFDSQGAVFLPADGKMASPTAMPATPRKWVLRQMARNIVGERLPFLLLDPGRSLAAAALPAAGYSSPRFRARYRGILANIGQPALCVIEHVGFAALLPINAQHGIPTISCIQNIESFDAVAPLAYEQKRETYITAINFAHEFRTLAQCQERLFISKVEAGLIGGLGLPSHYYAYVPAGTIRRNLDRIREERANRNITSGLFLMLGSAAHSTTREAFSWFVGNVRRHGLPNGVRVVVAGSETDELLPQGVSAPGLELKGWLAQEQLDQLLTRVDAVLVPQRVGFGAVTRLAELSCTGVPAIVSRHATYAIDMTPGIHVVDDSWDAWCSGMHHVMRREERFSKDEYVAWERAQGDALAEVARELLGKL